MIRAGYNDKEHVASILTEAFDDNKSVNYIIKQDRNRTQRIQRLMEYAFDMAYNFGDVFLSDDRLACALVLFPDQQKTTLQSILLDIKLAISCVGLSHIKRALDRESRIKKLHPKTPICHLWFVGVTPTAQNRGIGSALLNDIIKESASLHRPVYLETSTLKNIPWYEKSGFSIYHEFDFGYRLFCLRNG
jgi:ribosomal protein S18 acetylase RimI-like enzyme